MGEKELKALIGEIITLCDPMFVYLVSSKRDNKGNVTSVKLCVVVDDGLMPSEQEKKLLIETDTTVPIDYIVYNISDWNEYACEDYSFAYRVENGGEKLYVKGE